MEGILSNRWFIFIQLIIISGQVLIIFLGGKAFSVQPLDQATQWAVSVLLGALAVPVAVIIRLIPDEFIAKLILYMWPRAKSRELRVSEESRQYGWNPVLEEIRDHPAFMKKVRGGRLRHIIKKHRQDLLESRYSSHPPYSSTLPSAVGDMAANDHIVDGYLASPPASERTPLIHGS
jgi:Ca2+-transporting ATPase